ALAEGRSVRDRLAERDAARAQVTSVEAGREGVTRAREDLAAATRALEVEPALGMRDARRAAVERALKELGAARDLEVKVASALSAARDAAALQEAREPERERAAKEVGRLEAMDEAVRTLREAIAAWEEATREHRTRLGARDTLSKALEDADRNREALETDLAASVDAAAREDGLRARRDAAVKDFQERKELAVQVEAQERAARNLEAQTDRVKGLEDALRRAAEALDLADARWRAGQAAVLAQGLQEGQACPVCGATHHPAPATASAGEVPDDVELQTLRKERDEVAAALERARVDGASLHEQHKAIAEKVAAIRLRLGDRADTAPDSLEAAARDAEQALAEVAKRAQARDRLQKAVDDARAKRVGLQEQLQQAETALQAAAGALERSRALVDERGARVPEEVRAEGALEQALQGAREGLAALRKALDDARKNLGEVERRHAAALAALDGANRTVAAAEDDLAKAQAALAQAIVQAGFADEAAVVAARRTGAERDRLEGEVARFDKAFAEAKGRLQRAEEAARDLVPPDLAALEVRATETAKARQEHDQKVGAGRTRLQTLRGYAKELETLQAAGADAERRYGVLGRLSEVANGTNPLNLTFERYVLAALLDEVLVAATGRLLTMSQGRYELRRVEQPEDGRRAGGLGLEVLDYHTGLARSVTTLSGGEGFMASLALALGLADVVQAQAGGIRLDAIFVDEGFANLDPETLEHAIRMLQALQVSGRLVGIISHLPTLRENIDVRLEVIAGHGGSSTRFVPADCAT
ncbi:MAG TPA: SbcC/MukB-like Walker B domain-containing protein, partial [Myxococcota bacterium]|nr:SbcC/MukB-like Walker B domain-containing protein [Myxococcota bacterium]